jgi:hypothetical protein
MKHLTSVSGTSGEGHHELVVVSCRPVYAEVKVWLGRAQFARALGQSA